MNYRATSSISLLDLTPAGIAKRLNILPLKTIGWSYFDVRETSMLCHPLLRLILFLATYHIRVSFKIKDLEIIFL